MLASVDRYTLCEVLREIWRLAENMPEGRGKDEMKVKIRLATAMGKAISKSLQDYDPGWYEKMYDRKEDIQ